LLEVPHKRALRFWRWIKRLTTSKRGDAQEARFIKLPFLGGQSVEETAEFLQISPQSVMRDWKTG
jgi:hypothetical protein